MPFNKNNHRPLGSAEGESNGPEFHSRALGLCAGILADSNHHRLNIKKIKRQIATGYRTAFEYVHLSIPMKTAR